MARLSIAFVMVPFIDGISFAGASVDDRPVPLHTGDPEA
jgi:hypothetical protein